MVAPLFLEALARQRQKLESFAVATVVQVHGSASAREGSKAIFDKMGRNIFGWVGGGCAERFVGEQSIEAINSGRTRVVTADLDDEIFGLGIACGGKMDIFIEPILPETTVALPSQGDFSRSIEQMCRSYGWPLTWSTSCQFPQSFAEALMAYINALAASRERRIRSLRDVKELNVNFKTTQLQFQDELVVLGQSRISEALAGFANALGWRVTLKAFALDKNRYPQNIRCDCLAHSYEDVQFSKGQMVVIASHHSQDPQTVFRAARSGCSYVGMVGSRKRALEVLTLFESTIEAPVFVPAGLDIDARGPEEIALSVIGEILLLRGQRGS